MTVKRYKDPAGLLPDRVTVNLDGHPDDINALVEVLKAAAPATRVERLRIHPELRERADELAEMLQKTGGNADHRLLGMIAQAECSALYLKAAPEAKTGHKVRKPFKDANAGRAAESKAWQTDLQARANAKWAEAQHAGKTISEIARLIAKPGENPGTIRRKIKKLA